MPLTASAMVRVVINALSAAGSRMLPSTECMLNRLAKYPSTCISRPFIIPSARRVASPISRRITHEIREASVDEQAGCEVKIVVENGPPEDGACEDARGGQQVRNGVDVFAKGGSFARVGLVLWRPWVRLDDRGWTCILYPTCRCKSPPQKRGRCEPDLTTKVGGNAARKNGWRSSTRETEHTANSDQ